MRALESGRGPCLASNTSSRMGCTCLGRRAGRPDLHRDIAIVHLRHSCTVCTTRCKNLSRRCMATGVAGAEPAPQRRRRRCRTRGAQHPKALQSLINLRNWARDRNLTVQILPLCSATPPQPLSTVQLDAPHIGELGHNGALWTCT